MPVDVIPPPTGFSPAPLPSPGFPMTAEQVYEATAALVWQSQATWIIAATGIVLMLVLLSRMVPR